MLTFCGPQRLPTTCTSGHGHVRRAGGKIVAQSFTGKITPKGEHTSSFRGAAQQADQADRLRRQLIGRS